MVWTPLDVMSRMCCMNQTYGNFVSVYIYIYDMTCLLWRFNYQCIHQIISACMVMTIASWEGQPAFQVFLRFATPRFLDGWKSVATNIAPVRMGWRVFGGNPCKITIHAASSFMLPKIRSAPPKKKEKTEKQHKKGAPTSYPWSYNPYKLNGFIYGQLRL